MTQPAPTDTAAETGAQADGNQVPDLLPANAATSIAPDILATLPPTEPTNDDGSDEEADLAGGSEDEQPTGEAEPDAPDEVSEWIAQIAENPGAITTVPRARQAETVARILETAGAVADDAFRQGFEQGMQRARTTATLQEQVRELDTLFEDGDTAAFNERVAEFPGGKKNYFRVKADMEPIPAGSPQQYQQRAAQLYAELDGFPEAQQALQANWDFRANEADMIRLAQTVGAMKERARGAVRTPAEPTPLQKRRDAQAALKKTPKPDVSPGVAAGTGELAPEELRTLTTEQVAQMMRTPEGQARLKKAAAAAG